MNYNARITLQARDIFPKDGIDIRGTHTRMCGALASLCKSALRTR